MFCRSCRVSGAVVNGSEVCVLVAAVVILLSMLGLNLSGLLIPAGVALALAAKDLSHNFLAGFFLFAVQVHTLRLCYSLFLRFKTSLSSHMRSQWAAKDLSQNFLACFFVVAVHHRNPLNHLPASQPANRA